jgi:ubiquinone biosynthesis protein
MDPRRLARQSRRALREAGDLAMRLPQDVSMIARRLRQGKFQVQIRHEHLETLEQTLGRSSNRIAFALIIAGLLVGSSLLLVNPDGNIEGLISLQSLGVLGYIVAMVLGLWLLWSIIRGRHV